MKPHAVLVADPPWEFDDDLPGETRGASKQYKTLSLDDIKRFPLPPLRDDALLFLWRVSAMVPEAYEVVKAWGFEFKSEIVWQKLTKHGKKHFGMGHYVRASHETAIIAVRGRPKISSHSIRSTFEAIAPPTPKGRARHSAKPEEFFNIVEEISKGPYSELFARRHRKGWSCFGDELPPQRPILLAA